MSRQLSPKARERKLRARFRRNIRIAVVISLIIGLALGFVAGQYFEKNNLLKDEKVVKTGAAATAKPKLKLDSTPVPTEAPTAEPAVEVTEAPTPTPTPVPTATPAPQVVIVPFGTAAEISAQIQNDGSVRRTVDSETYETLDFSLEVKRYMTPEYYQENYSTKYEIKGNEAGVEFELILIDYPGAHTIIPQDLFTIGLETIDGATDQGFQLTDAEIHGENKVTISTNIPKMFYKRFSFNPTIGDMDYLSVTSVVNGVPTKYLFELGEPIRPTPTPIPEIVYASLTIGSSGDEVETLQQALIDQGYLTGTADGKFGYMTEAAVRAAQEAFELTVTGIADNDFQHALYAADTADSE